MNILNPRTLFSMSKTVTLRAYVQFSNCIPLHPFAFILDSIFAYPKVCTFCFFISCNTTIILCQLQKKFVAFTEWNDVPLVFLK